MIVAIDGPSGAGKTSVSREVARRLAFSLLDTGALYRGVAVLARRHGIAFEAGVSLAEAIESSRFCFETVDGEQRLYLGEDDISETIRSPEMSEGASRVSAQPEVRDALLEVQRTLGRESDCVVEGRDIGTVVFPDAEHKFFLTASNEARVLRRKLQFAEKGRVVSDDELRREILERDERDASRDVAPMRPADDAMLVDSTGMSFDEVVEFIVGRVRR